MKALFSILCMFLIVVSLPLMAVFWVGGFVCALFTVAARNGFNAFMGTDEKAE